MNTAILVIDVQSALFESTPAPYEAQEVVGRINQLSAWARNSSIPVIFIQHEQPNSPVEFGSDGWQLQGNLHTSETDLLVRKTTPNSFLKTNLKEILDAHQIEHLIICGYASEFCVDTTTRQAAALGYSIELVADAHTTHDKKHAAAIWIREHHNQSLANIKSFGVKIAAVQTAELLGLR